MAVEVFAGNTADPMTVGAQIEKLRERFGLSKVVLVGDRGMLTEARVREEVQSAGLDWIGALRGPAIRKLVESGAVQLSLFDETDLVEVRSDAYPGERLMVCRNPLLAGERARKREELLKATEALLDPVVAATRWEKKRLQGEDKISERVGKLIGRYKMAKHFKWAIDENGCFRYWRDAESIAEARPRFCDSAREGVRIRPTQGAAQAQRRRAPPAQLPHPARRPGRRHQKPGGAPSARRRTVRRPHPADHTAERSLPVAWSPPLSVPSNVPLRSD